MALQLRDNKYFFSVLSSTLLHAPKPGYIFQQFALKEEDRSKGAGDTAYLNRYPYLGESGLTLAARAIGEGTTIGIEDPIAISPDAVGLVLTDYYGPYNSTANKVAPYGITEKTVSRAAAKLIDKQDPLSFTNSIGGAWLKDDHDRWIDRVLCATYLTTTNIRNPAGKLDAATLNTDKATTADFLYCLKFLRENNVMPFEDDCYVAIVPPQVEANLLEDADFKVAATRGGSDRIWKGEIGNYLGIRYVRSNNIPVVTVNSLTANQYLVFGKEAVGWCEGEVPEIRRNKNDDYERFFYLIWKGTYAFALLNSNFIVKGRSFA